MLRAKWCGVDLRPVEDFRHTAVIPISEKDLIEHRKKIDEKNRKGYYVEIRKDTIYFYTIALLTLGSIFYTFIMVNEKNMKIKQDLEHTRILRTKMREGKKGAGVISERAKDEHETRRPLF